MKALGIVVLAFCIAIGAGACGATSGGGANQIVPVKLTADQERMMSYMDKAGEKLLMYDFKTTEKYKSPAVWVEYYKDGVLSSRPIEVSEGSIGSDETKAWNGRLVIVSEKKPYCNWTIIFDEGDGVSYSKESEPNDVKDIVIDDREGLTSTFTSMSEARTIESGQEILLHAELFDDEKGQSLNEEVLKTQPDILKDYSQAILVKCKFTN